MYVEVLPENDLVRKTRFCFATACTMRVPTDPRSTPISLTAGLHGESRGVRPSIVRLVANDPYFSR